MHLRLRTLRSPKISRPVLTFLLSNKAHLATEYRMKLAQVALPLLLISSTAHALQGADSCSAPTPIGGQGIFGFDNTSATTGVEGQSENLCSFPAGIGIENDIWFAWTSDFTGNAQITTCGTTSDDTKIAAYQGTSCPTPGSALDCRDNYCGLQAAILLPVTAGTTYLLQVGNDPGSPAISTGALTISDTPPFRNPANDHYYYAISPGPIDWETARVASQSFSYLGATGHLATINDAAEADFLNSTFGNRAWVGASQDLNSPNYSEPLGAWTWVTGEAFSYSNWASGEPNNAGGSEHYLEMSAVGLFNDQPLDGGGAVTSFYVEFSDVLSSDVYCSGDGFGTACPCGNNGFSDEGCANGTGTGGRLRATGTASVTAADLTLVGSQLIPSQPGLYFQGNNAINGGNGNSFGDGLRCAGGSVVRLQVRFSDITGGSATSIDIAAAGSANSGDIKRYQIWYRDPVGSPCGALFNLSNGLEITFTP